MPADLIKQLYKWKIFVNKFPVFYKVLWPFENLFSFFSVAYKSPHNICIPSKNVGTQHATQKIRKTVAPSHRYKIYTTLNSLYYYYLICWLSDKNVMQLS